MDNEAEVNLWDNALEISVHVIFFNMTNTLMLRLSLFKATKQSYQLYLQKMATQTYKMFVLALASD